jgi:hypothetical protein
LSTSPVSSHTKYSSSPRLASRTRLPKTKVAPAKFTTRNEPFLRPTKLTQSESSSTAETTPVNFSGIPPFVTTVTLRTVLDFFHIRNLSNISLDEVIFLHVLYGSLATQARMLAAILPGSVQRPLQALLAAMNEPGRSYNARSAKRKRLSNSPASSRKRS